jgi:hypothetical protein
MKVLESVFVATLMVAGIITVALFPVTLIIILYKFL